MPVTVRTPAVSTCLLSVTVNDPRLITVLGAGLRISGMGGKNGRAGAPIEPARVVALADAGVHDGTGHSGGVEDGRQGDRVDGKGADGLDAVSGGGRRGSTGGCGGGRPCAPDPRQRSRHPEGATENL